MKTFLCIYIYIYIYSKNIIGTNYQFYISLGQDSGEKHEHNMELFS